MTNNLLAQALPRPIHIRSVHIKPSTHPQRDAFTPRYLPACTHARTKKQTKKTYETNKTTNKQPNNK